MNRVAGKTVLVTGAGRGQGRSHCQTLAAEGADVIAVDACRPIDGVPYPMSTPDELAATAELVRAQGRRVITAEVDVRDEKELTAAVADAVNELGKLDVIVANAGVVLAGTWDEITPEAWSAAIDVNLTGVWHTCRAGLGHVLDAGGGSVVITSSYAGLRGAPFLAPYVASKHGVTGLARELANELAEYHIRVNTVHPTGVSETGMRIPRLMELLDQHPKLAPAYVNALDVTMVDPIDISNAVLYLASDESRYVTGTSLPVDAGVTNL